MRILKGLCNGFLA